MARTVKIQDEWFKGFRPELLPQADIMQFYGGMVNKEASRWRLGLSSNITTAPRVVLTSAGGGTDPFLLRRSTDAISRERTRIRFIARTSPNGGGHDVVCVARGTASSANAYYARTLNGRLYLQTMVGGSGGTIGNVASDVACTLTTGVEYDLTCTAYGSSPTTVHGKVTLASTPGTIIAQVSGTNSNASLTSATGTGGVYTFNGGDYEITRLSRWQVGDQFTTGEAECFPSTTGILLVAPPPDLGTSPFAYQWQRSTNLTTWSSLSGATTLSHTDTTAAADTDYFYRLRVIDSAGSPATEYSNYLGPVRRQQPALKIGLLMDSFGATDASRSTEGHGRLADLMFPILDRRFGSDRAILVDGSHAESSTDSGTGVLGWNGTTRLTTAIAAWTASGCTDIYLQLGVNDSRLIGMTAAAYYTNMAAICTALIAAGFQPWIGYTPYYPLDQTMGTDGSNWLLIQQYHAKIDLLVTNGFARRGPTTDNTRGFALNNHEFDEQILHPMEAGMYRLAENVANAFWLYLKGATSGAGGNGNGQTMQVVDDAETMELVDA